MIAAIILERNLQNVANYLILSLAVADLLVAVLVMPLGAVYEVSLGLLSEWQHPFTHEPRSNICMAKTTILVACTPREIKHWYYDLYVC